jgi:site-specific DNA recombinase
MTSQYLFSGVLKCGACGASFIIVSGSGSGGKRSRYGCPQHWSRKACSNGYTVHHAAVEKTLLSELQSAVLSPEVQEYLVDKVFKLAQKKKSSSDYDKRVRELKAEINRLVNAIAVMGHSEAIIANLKAKEQELRQLNAAKEQSRDHSESDIRVHVQNALLDIPGLLKRDSAVAKSKLSQHVSDVRMMPQEDGSYVAEGEFSLLGDTSALLMVAGAGFEPATFGL